MPTKLIESDITKSAEQYLTPKQVAAQLAIGLSSVYLWAHSGHLPAVRLGKQAIRIPVSALKAYLQRQRIVPLGEE